MVKLLYKKYCEHITFFYIFVKKLFFVKYLLYMYTPNLIRLQ